MPRRITLRQAFGPYKTGKVLGPRRRVVRKRYRKLNALTRGVGLTRAIPSRQVIKMEYVTNGVLSKAIGATTAIWRIKANNIYDPETDNIGRNGTFSGFAQMAALYDRYKVISEDVSMTLFNTTTTSVPVAITRSDDTNPVTVADTVSILGARKNAECRLVCYEVPTYISFHYDVRKQFGIQKYAFDDNYYGTTSGTAPTKQCYFTISIGETSDGNSVATQVSFLVKIVATVQFMSPIEALT